MMKVNINLGTTAHDMGKVNLVTLPNGFDNYKCSRCGAKGVRKGFTKFMTIEGVEEKMYAAGCEKRFKRTKYPKTMAQNKRIRIIKCDAQGPAFANLTPASEHQVVNPPKGEYNGGGCWVMGVGEPVKVLHNEYNVIPNE